MPYIKQDRRQAFNLESAIPETPGELNYVFTMILKEYIERHGKSYKILNDVLGALEGTKLEFYRRVVVTYEDLKMYENGDVYES